MRSGFVMLNRSADEIGKTRTTLTGHPYLPASTSHDLRAWREQ